MIIRRLLLSGVAFALLITGCGGKPRVAVTPTLAMWFWHSPLALTKEDLGRLKSMGVTELYARAGTLSTDGEKVVLSLPQTFKEPIGLPIHLVFRADPGVLHRFEEIPIPELADIIARNYLAAKADADRVHDTVRGLQLDLDVPTRLLPRYAQLLHAIRPMIPAEDKLSITSLATWFASRDLEAVVKELDFYAPQFYEASVPQTLDDERPIANLKQLDDGLIAAEQLDVPFLIGAPCYGQALLFDKDGKIAGTYRGLSPDGASRHASLKKVSWSSSQGEERLIFEAVKAGAQGKGLGFKILYRRPTPQAIQSFFQEAQRKRPPNCLGIALFRVPEPGETLATPLPTLVSALAGKVPSLILKIVPTLRRLPFAAIESSSSKISTELKLSIEGIGDGDTCLGSDALRIQILAPQGAFEEVQSGGFGGASPFVGSPAQAGTVSLRRADGVVLWKSHLGPGEKVAVGPILLTGAGRLRVLWTLRDPSGVETTGEMKDVMFGGDLK